MKKIKVVLTFISILLLASCSYNTPNNYLESGTILVSKSVGNYINTASLNDNTNTEMNKLLGFFPASDDFSPAFNELWLEIDTQNETISVKNGSKVIHHFNTFGAKFTSRGHFFVTSKDKAPKWQAPNSYFTSRGLQVPSDKTRAGAYGSVAIFGTNNLVIHSSPFWTSEVGGVKVSESKLNTFFNKLPVGSPIVVK